MGYAAGLLLVVVLFSFLLFASDALIKRFDGGRTLPIWEIAATKAAAEERAPRIMPEGVTWTKPEGGFCCWLTLPGRDAFRDLHRAALTRGLIVAPGEVFLVEPDAGAHFRLCFGNQTEETIREAVRELADLIRERMNGRTPHRLAVPDRAPLV